MQNHPLCRTRFGQYQASCGLCVHGYIRVLCNTGSMCVCGLCVHGYIHVLCNTSSMCVCGLCVHGYIRMLCNTSSMCVCGVCVHGYIRMLCSTGSMCVCGVCVSMDTYACCVYMHMYASMCGTSKVTEMEQPDNDHSSVHGYTCALMV